MQLGKFAGMAILAGVAFAGGAIYGANKLMLYALTHDIDIEVNDDRHNRVIQSKETVVMNENKVGEDTENEESVADTDETDLKQEEEECTVVDDTVDSADSVSQEDTRAENIDSQEASQEVPEKKTQPKTRRKRAKKEPTD